MEQEFLTGKCPKCMQELRFPASLAEFSCMYCGARLAQSDLVTEAAETPAAPDADAYAAALEELSGCIRNYRGFHKRVTKTDYVPAFDEYEAAAAPWSSGWMPGGGLPPMRALRSSAPQPDG